MRGGGNVFWFAFVKTGRGAASGAGAGPGGLDYVFNVEDFVLEGTHFERNIEGDTPPPCLPTVLVATAAAIEALD